MLLQEPEKQHADDILSASPGSDIFSCDLSTEDILMMDDLASPSKDKLFVEGEMNDVHALLSWILESVSPQLRALVSFENAYQFNLCIHDEGDVSINNRSLQSLPFIENYPTMKYYNLAQKIKDSKNQRLLAWVNYSVKAFLNYYINCESQVFAPDVIKNVLSDAILLLKNLSRHFYSSLNLQTLTLTTSMSLGILLRRIHSLTFLQLSLSSLQCQSSASFMQGYTSGLKIGNLKSSCEELVPGSGFNPISKATNSIVVCYKKKSSKNIFLL